jgi:hypothetical protein
MFVYAVLVDPSVDEEESRPYIPRLSLAFQTLKQQKSRKPPETDKALALIPA